MNLDTCRNLTYNMNERVEALYCHLMTACSFNLDAFNALTGSSLVSCFTSFLSAERQPVNADDEAVITYMIAASSFVEVQHV